MELERSCRKENSSRISRRSRRPHGQSFCAHRRDPPTRQGFMADETKSRQTAHAADGRV
jgi:hypothetical protein